MQLKNLRISRHEWGNDKGKLFGEITLEGTDTMTQLKISEHCANQIVALVATAIQEEAHRLSKIMAGDIAPALPAPIEEVIDDEIPY